MPRSNLLAALLVAIFAALVTSPASAQGEIVITQLKALAGNVSPGDTAGFPVSLSQSGAYILGSNLSVPSGQVGISVNAHNVDLDLNGFTIAGAGVAGYGVYSGYGENRIRGGVIVRFKYSGIYIRNNSWTIEDMRIVRNGSSGIDATGARLVEVRNSVISGNGRYGVVSGETSLFRGNKISDNIYMGIYCRDGCLVDGNIIDKNLYRVQIDSGLVTGNTISRNQYEGIYDSGGSDVDTGVSNNMLINNNAASVAQVVRTIDVHPNTCVGNPCRAQ